MGCLLLFKTSKTKHQKQHLFDVDGNLIKYNKNEVSDLFDDRLHENIQVENQLADSRLH